jgi:hypothetical protein
MIRPALVMFVCLATAAGIWALMLGPVVTNNPATDYPEGSLS